MHRAVRCLDRPYRLAVGEHVLTTVDPGVRAVLDTLCRQAASAVPVLIGGETGAGKELAAHAVHAWSPRHAARLWSINCAALPAALLEAELFGHERGAYTGAATARPGLFEQASGSTLFLDEVGELPLDAQAKLLRVLDGRAVVRLGSTDERPIDVRIVAATNRDLRAEVHARRFREDLYFRLRGAAVSVPPLRDRPADLPLLAAELLAAACADLGRSPLTVSPAALAVLARHRWPGNVRELRHAMAFAAASSPAVATTVEPGHLPPDVTEPPPPPPPDATAPPAPPPPGAATPAPGAPRRLALGTSPALAIDPDAPLPAIHDAVADLERTLMARALERTGHNRTRAAALLQMPRRTFVAKLARYGLARPRRRRSK